MQIVLVNDEIGLQANETFPLRVTVLEPADAVDIISPESTLTIVDDEGKKKK